MSNVAQSHRPLLTVALDGGTTNTRARLLEDHRVVATARRSVGVRDSVLDHRADRLAEALRDCLIELYQCAGAIKPARIVAAGMLSSEVGLVAVPHIPAPAGLGEIAKGVIIRQLPQVTDQPIHFIPGVRTPAAEGPDGWAVADVMRGEECETLGVLATMQDEAVGRSTPPRRAFLWPGSHTKLVEVDASGRIVRSHTTLAGELMAALAKHTLLAASLPEEWPAELDPDAVAAGARLVEREGLGRSAFLVRMADLTKAWPVDARAAFWMGAVVAEDVLRLARHPSLAESDAIWVGGRQPQRGLYAAFLARKIGGSVVALDDHLAEVASALGALAVADRHAGLGQGAAAGLLA